MSVSIDAPLVLRPGRATSSNLAITLIGLPAPVRRDVMLFYHFCRAVDDVADDCGRPAEERRAELKRWRAAIQDPSSGVLPPEFAAMLKRTGLDTALLEAILDGMENDLREPVRIQDEAELELYCWRVASAVGLASAWLFGSRSESGKEFANKLGQALQLTNILRDVAEDAAMNRIYLPMQRLSKFGVSEQDFLAGKSGPGMQSLLQASADSALEAFAQVAAGPPADERREFRPAMAMMETYRQLLEKMRQDGLQVWKKRYRLSWPVKARILWRNLLS